MNSIENDDKSANVGSGMASWHLRLLSAWMDIDFYVDEQEGKVSDMCKALDDIIKIGEARGEAKKETSIILNMFRKGISCEEISSMTDIPLDKVKEVVEVQ